MPVFMKTWFSLQRAYQVEPGQPIVLTALTPVSGVFQPGNAGLGTWTIGYTVAQECEKTVYQTIDVLECLSVNEVAGQSMTIYPNPSSDIFNISLGQDISDNASLIIRDIYGKGSSVRPV